MCFYIEYVFFFFLIFTLVHALEEKEKNRGEEANLVKLISKLLIGQETILKRLESLESKVDGMLMKREK